MALIPFRRDPRAIRSDASASQSGAPLTLSQALTITAGMAGLVGLLSAGFVRFSLANSADSSFLSPLQTFPALSDWSSLPESADSDASATGDALNEASSNRWEAPADLDWDSSNSDFDTFSSEGFTDSESTSDLQLESSEDWDRSSQSDSAWRSNTDLDLDAIPPQDFSTFADRKEGQRRTAEDPLDSLSNGPLLRDSAPDDNFVGGEEFVPETDRYDEAPIPEADSYYEDPVPETDNYYEAPVPEADSYYEDPIPEADSYYEEDPL